MSNTLHATTALASFMRATNGDLPEPSGVNIYDHPQYAPEVDFTFHALDDLREWAQMLGVEVTGGDRLTQFGTYHHRLDATWPAHDGTSVRFSSTFIATPVESDPPDCESVEVSA